METSRRTFTGGLLGVALAPPAIAARPTTPPLAAALRSIEAFAHQHRRHFNLPGLTLGLRSPSGFETVVDSGFADPATQRPITSETLFQIGSISKCMVVVLLHQFAQEGRLRLDANFAALMPDLTLPKGSPITVQHVIDHVAGLPGDAPLFPPGGLWLAYKPGEHWHYSNTGYDMLGKLAEQIGRKPLYQLLRERLFSKLGMRRSHGAIVAAHRHLYAQGHEAADPGVPYARGMTLMPAAWVDVTFGAGSIASTATDMIRFMHSLADAAQGRGGLGLGPQQGRIFTSHFVTSDTPGRDYGNGLMRVKDAGRTYLHHTGGMTSFSSAFHVDVASGAGAFASSTLTGNAGYRPRTLTLFAAQALTAAEAGQPLPAAPSLDPPLENAAALAGRYTAAGRTLEVRMADRLSIRSGGREAALQPAGDDRFRTLHPGFAEHTLWFERANGHVVAVHWGPDTYVKAGAQARPGAHDPTLARLAGRFVNDSPWIGLVHVVERGSKLWLGTDTPLTAIGPNRWRIGDDSWSPERAWFANFIDGRPQSFFYSGNEFLRHDI